MRNAAVTPQLQLSLIIIIVCWRLWKPQTVTSGELNVQSTPDNSNPCQLEPRANSNQKSISPGFPSYIYHNFTLSNSSYFPISGSLLQTPDSYLSLTHLFRDRLP